MTTTKDETKKVEEIQEVVVKPKKKKNYLIR
jgi:hypothetical protein